MYPGSICPIRLWVPNAQIEKNLPFLLNFFRLQGYKCLMSIIRNSRKSGQTMLEYVMVLAMTLGLIVTLGFFMFVFKAHGGRILDLISSVYP